MTWENVRRKLTSPWKEEIRKGVKETAAHLSSHQRWGIINSVNTNIYTVHVRYKEFLQSENNKVIHVKCLNIN